MGMLQNSMLKMGTLIAGLSLSSAVFAASAVGHAHVVIVPAIHINEISAVNFGQLSNVNGTCSMSANGDLVGTAGMDCAGSETPGKFTVSGLEGAVVTINVEQGFDGGVTFHPIVDGSANRTLVDGTAEITVRGDLVLDNAIDGEKNINYRFTANYE